MNFINIGLSLAGGIILWYFVRFFRYMGTYLIPQRIKIIDVSKDEEYYQTTFVVVFFQGFFKRKYISANGMIKTASELRYEHLKQVLMVTEISKFYSHDHSKSFQYEYFESDCGGNVTVDYTVFTDEMLNSVDKIRAQLRDK